VGVFVLGTEPSLFIAPPIQSRELDYEEAEKELVSLRRVIAEAGEQSKPLIRIIQSMNPLTCFHINCLDFIDFFDWRSCRESRESG